MKNKLVLSIFLLTILFTGCSNKQGLEMSTEDGILFFTTNNDLENTSHIAETIYEGNDLPSIIYEYPFGRSEEEMYVCNKDLLNNELEKDSAVSYLNKAKDVNLLLFANNYLELENSQEEFINNVIKNYEGTSSIMISEEEDMQPEEYASYLLENYIDNKIEIDGEYQTDLSLIYRDAYMYKVRGVLTLTALTDAENEYYNLFKIKVPKGETHSYMTEVRFVPGNPEKILGIDIISEIKTD